MTTKPASHGDSPCGPGLHLVDLGKDYGGRVVLDQLNCSVLPGQLVALHGPNGAGKTTVLRCVLGLTPPSRGSVLLHDVVLAAGPDAPLSALPAQARQATHRIVSVTDEHAFLPSLTASEHLDLMARAHGNATPEQLVQEALETLRIDHVADLHPYSLSSGQRRRLLLASLLVRPSELMVLDEPEQRLDDAGLTWLAGFLSHQAAQGTAILMASHHPGLIEATQADVVQIAAHDA